MVGCARSVRNRSTPLIHLPHIRGPLDFDGQDFDLERFLQFEMPAGFTP